MTASATADLILFGGKVVTVDPAFSIAEAVAIRGDRILAVGRDAEIRALGHPRAQTIDLKGATVVPGLIDGHAHLDREGLKDVFPSLAGCRSIGDIQSKIAMLAARAKLGEWIVTMPVGDPPYYWNAPEGLTEKRYPDRWDLDRAAPHNPVFIRPIWGYWRHAPNPDTIVSIANSRALEAAGIGRETQAPSATVTIERERASNEPTGRILEKANRSIAELTLFSVVPGFDDAMRAAALERAMRIYNRFGTTAVYEGHGASVDAIRAYQNVHRRGAMTVRAHMTLSPSWRSVPIDDPGHLIECWAGWLASDGFGDEWFRVVGLTAEFGFEPDNVLRASARPYTSWAGFNYDAGLPNERLPSVLAAAARLGIRIAAIGLGFLELFEAANRIAPIARRRWVIEHPGVIPPQAFAKLKELGIVLTPLSGRFIYKEGNAAPNPYRHPADGSFMPLKSMMTAGVPFALETDNVPASLWHPVWHAVARKDRFGNDVAPAAEKLTRADALRAATMGGAYLLRREAAMGSIEPGKYADLVVLADDYLGCPEDAIKDLEARITIAGGRVVYSA